MRGSMLMVRGGAFTKQLDSTLFQTHVHPHLLAHSSVIVYGTARLGSTPLVFRCARWAGAGGSALIVASQPFPLRSPFPSHAQVICWPPSLLWHTTSCLSWLHT